MRLLLDTHVFIWVVTDDPRLDQRARTIIEEASAVYVSAASIWVAVWGQALRFAFEIYFDYARVKRKA